MYLIPKVKVKTFSNSSKEGLVFCMSFLSGWIFNSLKQYYTSLLASLFMSNECCINCWYTLFCLSQYSPLSSSWSSTSILVNKHASNPAKNVLLTAGRPSLWAQQASFKIWQDHFSLSCIFGGLAQVTSFSREEFQTPCQNSGQQA